MFSCLLEEMSIGIKSVWCSQACHFAVFYTVTRRLRKKIAKENAKASHWEARNVVVSTAFLLQRERALRKKTFSGTVEQMPIAICTKNSSSPGVMIRNLWRTEDRQQRYGMVVMFGGLLSLCTHFGGTFVLQAYLPLRFGLLHWYIQLTTNVPIQVRASRYSFVTWRNSPLPS